MGYLSRRFKQQLFQAHASLDALWLVQTTHACWQPMAPCGAGDKMEMEILAMAHF
jgi:hypothetical protein